MGKKKLFFQRPSDPPQLWNIAIGGVAAQLSTPALFAAKFTFDEASITYFEIIGDDVYVFSDYALTWDIGYKAFSNNKQITFYRGHKESQGTTGRNAFENSTLNYYEVLHYVSLRQQSFYLCSSLSPSNIILPELRMNLECHNAFNGIINDGTILDLSSVEGIPSINALSIFRNLNNVTVDLRNCTEILGNGDMHNYSAATFLYYKLKNISGDSSTVSGRFNLINSSATLYVNNYLRTNNSGSVDASIQYCIDIGCTVYFTDDNGNVIP